jgi:hypothetical protein
VALAIAAALLAPSAAQGARGESLKLKVSGGEQTSVTVRPGTKPTKLAVRLNGKRISSLFRGRPSDASRVILGADDGLRRGRNRVVVKARFASGEVVKKKRTFRRSRRSPIPSAGPSRFVYGGDSIRLSAAKSRSGAGKGRGARKRLAYTWKVQRAPRGSKAKLKLKHSARPRLVTDAPGVYKVRVRVRQGSGRPAADTVQIDAMDPKLTLAGSFVATMPLGQDGPPTGLQFYSGSIEGTYPLGASGSGRSVVTFFLDRATLAPLVGSPIYTDGAAADATTLTNALAKARKQTGRTPLVVTTGNTTVSPQFQQWLAETLDAPGLAGEIDGAPPSTFSVAGTPPDFFNLSSPPATGSMHSVAPSLLPQNRLSGQILTDAQGNWAFTPSAVPALGPETGTEVRFDTAHDGAIEVGGNSFPSDPPNCQNGGGFQLLAVQAQQGPAQLLEPPPISANINEVIPLLPSRVFNNGDTFVTNPCDGDQEEALEQVIGLYAVLNAIPKGGDPDTPTSLVFLQSVGDPTLPFDLEGDLPDAYDALGGEIRNVGGSPEAFLAALDGEAGNSGYSLVGQSFPNAQRQFAISTAEVSTGGPSGSPARLIGALAYDPAGRLLPIAATAADGQRATNLRQPTMLTHLTAEVDPATYQPTPFPNASDEDWQAALQDAAEILGLTYQAETACYRPPGGVADVRSNYCDGVPVDSTPGTYWEDLYNDRLADAPVPAGSGFTSEFWGSVKEQLHAEFELVDDANGTADALRKTFTATMANDTDTIATQLISDYKQLKQKALASRGTSHLGFLSDIFDALAAVSGFATDEVSNYLWAASSGLGLWSDFVTDDSGMPVFTDPIQGTTAGELNSQIAVQVVFGNLARDAQVDAIVSDWNRLQGAAADAARIPVTQVADASVQSARLGNISSTWQTLMGTAANLDRLAPSQFENPAGTQPPKYACWVDGRSGPAPLNGVYPYSTFAEPAYFERFDGNDEGPYALSVLGTNPTSTPDSPAKASAFPQEPPTATLQSFFSPQPASTSSLSPVENGVSPGLGIDPRIFYNRLIQRYNETGRTREVKCTAGS